MSRCTRAIFDFLAVTSLGSMPRGAVEVRRCLVTSLVALLLGLGTLSAGNGQAPSWVVVIRGGTLWSDGLGFVPNASVVIRDGRIESIGAAVRAPAGAAVIDASNRFILPGLIDAHTQLGLRGDSIGWDTDEDVRPLTPELRVPRRLLPVRPRGSRSARRRHYHSARGPGRQERHRRPGVHRQARRTRHSSRTSSVHVRRSR